jgi:colanic acid/amylovoran biosynthesis glycosyltransferase
MPSSLHLLDSYLPRTETFIWQTLRALRRFPPLIVADKRENEALFPLPNHDPFLSLTPSRPLASRLWARATGTFAPVHYSGGLEALKSRDIAVCHVHKGYRALVTRDFTRALGKPLLVNFYGSDVSQKSFLRRASSGYRTLFEQARFLLVEGPAMRDRLLGLGASADRIRIQRIAIDPAEYVFRERTWDGIRPVNFLFIGRFVDKKGLDVGLRALASGCSGFSWKLTVIGDGPRRAELVALAARLGIAAHVDFVGYKTLSEMRAALGAHDLLLQPSRNAPDGDAEGGAPTVILEAQAAGMPVVSTDHDDIPFVTVSAVSNDGFTSAWLASQGDVDSLSAVLRRAVAEADQWGIMGRTGRAKIEADHDVARAVDALENTYADALM